jgi:hypothetical protein
MESTVADGKDGSDEQLKAVGSAQLATIRLTGKDTKRPPPPRQYGMIQVHFTNNTVNDHPARDRDSAEDATSASY